MVKFRSAALAFKSLNGVICVYKPSCVPVKQVQHTIVTNLCRGQISLFYSQITNMDKVFRLVSTSNKFYSFSDLNDLPDRPIEQRVEIVGPTNAPMQVKLVPNYADNPLVCGPRYINEDFRCSVASYLGLFSSGVLCKYFKRITKCLCKLFYWLKI